MTRLFYTLAVILFLTVTATAAEVGEDGLHKQSWFATSFRDMAEDIHTAKDEGKRLAIIFEQRGCIYCRKLHQEVLSDEKVANYIKDNFMVVQYNLYGDEEVTDLDGETLTEKTAARKWRVVFTPTIIFLPEEADDKKDVGQAAVSTIPGAFGKGTTLHMFEWVKAKGYGGEEPFQKYHARRLREDPNPNMD
ncbi:MAG: thioredoxin family protein [Rhizobiaceae bacterium]